MTEAEQRTRRLEHIAAVTVAHFGDLASTMRSLRDLTPADVDELKRITRDAPIMDTGRHRT